jgi:predicted DNA-binding antitoxin AbrB/MazE fold protein
MTLALEAVFEDGVLKPLHPLNLAEHQKVQLVLETGTPPEAPGQKLWHWREAQKIEDHFGGEVAAEVHRQRREA